MIKKITKQFLPLLFLATTFSACKDEEENYPIEPHINFVKVEVVDALSVPADTIRVVFSFTDGDGDVGLDFNNPDHVSFPYNRLFFFLKNNGALDTIHTIAAQSAAGDMYNILDVPNAPSGSLVLSRTRSEPGYEFLPEIDCQHYEDVQYDRVLVESSDKSILDPTVEVDETIQLGTKTYVLLRETLLKLNNPDFANLEVDFLVDGGSGFEEFDWYQLHCGMFDARVQPTCKQFCGPLKVRMFSKKRGEITYNMVSAGFRNLFKDKKIKLRLQLKDRALHPSNIMETPEFMTEELN